MGIGLDVASGATGAVSLIRSGAVGLMRLSGSVGGEVGSTASGIRRIGATANEVKPAQASVGEGVATEGGADSIPPRNRGVHDVLEASSKSDAAQAYEDSLPGAVYDIETRKKIAPALRFENPNPRGKSEVRFDGRDINNPKILIDRKLNVTTKSKQLADLRRWAEALKQNPDYSVRIEVPSIAAQRNAIRMIEKANVADAPITVKVAE
ncbi:MAG: hypothetical protein IPK97_20385 [Ahniella sp.]|nr:hypothetical protein [Ahniella sp.]